MIKNYKELSIRELHNALVNKEITPLELTKLALEEAKNSDFVKSVLPEGYII